MIHITDKTLSCLDEFNASGEQLRTFAELLVSIGVENIEISEKARFLMGELPRGGVYVLSGSKPELTIKRPLEIYTFSEHEGHADVRICGLGEVLLGDYLEVFKRIHQTFGEQVELCPTNECFCATAIAAEWAHFGGKSVVTGFGGIGGHAATEELLMHLEVKRAQGRERRFSQFPLMRREIEAITGLPFSRNKPVLGTDIFVVESGIHVDGVVKQPKCYEPFSPESVGLTRAITLSKQSGMASIRTKLNEQDIYVEQRYLPKLLGAVKKRSIEVNGSVSDEEFTSMARQIAASA